MTSHNTPGMRAAPSSILLILLFVVGGSLAATGAGYASNEYYDYFTMPQELNDEYERSKGANPPQELMNRMRIAGIRNEYQNAALVVGMSGGLLCGLLGVFAGFFRRGFAGAILGLITGVVVGAAVGGGGGLLARFVAAQIPINQTDEMQALFRATAIQAGAWAPVGLAAGMVVGLLTGRMRSFMGISVSSLLAAGIGGALYPIASMILFPVNRLTRPLPESLDVAHLWAGIPCVIVAIAAGQLFAKSLPKLAESPPKSESASATS